MQLAEFNSLVLKFIDFVQIQKIYHDSIDLNSTGFDKVYGQNVIFFLGGGGAGVVDGEGGSSERCLKWGGGGH